MLQQVAGALAESGLDDQQRLVPTLHLDLESQLQDVVLEGPQIGGPIEQRIGLEGPARRASGVAGHLVEERRSGVIEHPVGEAGEGDLAP